MKQLNQTKRILVIGATGMLGEPVARALDKAGYQVRILARKLKQAHAKFGENYEVFEGDVEHPQTLEPALQGCYGVHINLAGGPLPDNYNAIEYQGTANVASAAARLGIKRLSYISGASVSEQNSWFYAINAKYEAEKAIQRSGVPYFIFCPSWFMESLPRFIQADTATIIGKHPNPFHFVAAKDYASMVAKAYGLPEAANKRFFIYGPRALPMQDALQHYCDTVQPNVKVSTVPVQAMQNMARQTDNLVLKDITALMAYFEKLGEKLEAGDSQESNNLLGAPATTLEQWCAEKLDEKQLLSQKDKREVTAV